MTNSDDLLKRLEQAGKFLKVWGEVADGVVVYTDLGISQGMREGIGRAKCAGQSVDYRMLGGEWLRGVGE